MTDTERAHSDSDPSLTMGGVQVSGQELSMQRIGQLDATAQELAAALPEFVGMTLFGSVARGEPTPSSDVDIYVFIHPSERAPIQNNPHAPVPERMATFEEGSLRGTVVFHGAIDIDYRVMIQRKLVENGIGNATADIILLPIDESIVSSTTKDLLQNAKRWDDGDKSVGATVSRNVRGLFHVPINDEKLRPYITQALAQLQDSPHGETAWRMIRQQLIGSERNKTQIDYESVPHRTIPATLAEAVEYYSYAAPENLS